MEESPPPKPDVDLELLGPLAPLAGTWEGSKGGDVAPDDDRLTEHTPYRERVVFEPIGLVENHEQRLYGLRYATVAWRLGEPNPFHEEVGYWLWDGDRQHVMRCFIVPRGVSVIAGGTVAPGATRFHLSAELGSPTFGICSNPFLDVEFKTVRYDLDVHITGPDHFHYSEDTQLLMKGQSEPFHHTDENTLRRVEV